MKKVFLFVAFLTILVISSFSQADTTNRKGSPRSAQNDSVPKKDTVQLNKKVDSSKLKNGTTIEFKNKNFKFGVGIGFNYATKKIYDASLSPVDKSLKLQKIYLCRQ